MFEKHSEDVCIPITEGATRKLLVYVGRTLMVDYRFPLTPSTN